MDQETRRRWSGLVCLLLMGVALANSGCLAAAVGAAAGAGAAGYAYYKGRVTQDYNASLPDTQQALTAALADLSLPAEWGTPSGIGASAVSVESRTGTGDKVHITLDAIASPIPAEGPLTRVSVRVGMFGDAALSDRILAQISAHLVNRVPGATAATPGWTPAANARINPVPTQPITPANYVPQTQEPPLAPASSLPDRR